MKVLIRAAARDVSNSSFREGSLVISTSTGWKAIDSDVAIEYVKVVNLRSLDVLNKAVISPLRKRYRDSGASRYESELELFQFIVDNGAVAVHFKENAILRPVAGLAMFEVVREGKDIL
jgi:hypothetical protein